MFFECIESEFCELILRNCWFVNNTAHQTGGAIKWSSIELIIENCEFLNNNALEYGDDIAAIPDDIVLLETAQILNKD